MFAKGQCIICEGPSVSDFKGPRRRAPSSGCSALTRFTAVFVRSFLIKEGKEHWMVSAVPSTLGVGVLQKFVLFSSLQTSLSGAES